MTADNEKTINDNDTIRFLQWFEKVGDALIGKEEITSLSLLELRKIFNVTDAFPNGVVEFPYRENYDPYMINGYIVTEEHAKALQPYFKHKIDLTKYDYFVAAYEREA